MTLNPDHHYFFFFNDTATTEIYTLSLHDALPISRPSKPPAAGGHGWKATSRACPLSWSCLSLADQRSARLTEAGKKIAAGHACRATQSARRERFSGPAGPARAGEIGRASCRERV